MYTHKQLDAHNSDALINDIAQYYSQIAIKELELDITYVRNTVGIVFPPTFKFF